MTTRSTLVVRAFAFLALLTALFLAPAIGSAQAVDCSNTCNHFTVRVGRLACSVAICYQPADANPAICISVAPGGTATIPCGARVWVNTCSGPYYLYPSTSAALCSPVLKFAAGCCGRICNGPSVDPCTTLDITPAPCETPGCP